VTGLHSKIQVCLGDSFENAANQHPQTEALPSGFHPLQISMTLWDHGSWIHCLCLLDLPPQEIVKSSGPFVCQIVLDESSSLDMDLLAAVTAVSSAWQCLMCQSSSHLFNACPKISDLDSTTWCMVFASHLKAHGNSHLQSWSSSGPHPLQTPGINAISLDDTSTPFDEVAHDTIKLADDPNIIDNIEGCPDFQ